MSNLYILVALLVLGSHLADAARWRGKKGKSDEGNTGDVLLDAYYLSRFMDYCQQHPGKCDEIELARMLLKVEPDTKSRRRHRSKRSSSLLFMLFDQVSRDSQNSQNPPIPGLKVSTF